MSGGYGHIGDVLEELEKMLARDPTSRRWRNAVSEEKRGRSILGVHGFDSPLFSTTGAGAHSFSAYGKRYWAKDMNDPRFKQQSSTVGGVAPREPGAFVDLSMSGR